MKSKVINTKIRENLLVAPHLSAIQAVIALYGIRVHVIRRIKEVAPGLFSFLNDYDLFQKQNWKDLKAEKESVTFSIISALCQQYQEMGMESVGASNIPLLVALICSMCAYQGFIRGPNYKYHNGNETKK